MGGGTEAIKVMADEKTPNENVWYTGELTHEGFPLMLRFPEKPDFDSLQEIYPNLLTITHILGQVQSNGLPEHAYNETLADFDHEIITAFDQSLLGLAVLIETFGGRRTYYLYVASDAPVDTVKTRITKETLI